MSLGRRILKRGKVAVAAPIQQIRIGEPLLFLYPRWVRGLTASASETAPTDHTSHVDFGRRSSPALPQLRPRIEDHSRITGANTNENPPVVPGLHDIEDKWMRESEVGEVKSRTGSENVGTGQDSQRSVRKREVVRAILSRADTLGRKKAYERSVVSAIQTRTALDRDLSQPDWRRILAELKKTTPKHSEIWHEHGLRIKIEKEAIAPLLFGIDHNIWDIKARTDCHIELADAWDDQQGTRALLLSGSMTSIAKAASEITRIAPTAKADAQPVDQEMKDFVGRIGTRSPTRSQAKDTLEKLRYVVSNKTKYQARPRRADQVPKPKIWTPATFGEYVQHLTSMQFTGHLSSQYYTRNTTHHGSVVQILRDIFLDPNLRHALSTTALNDAFAYLVKRNEIKEVRQLFVHMEMRRVRMNTETFNIMLRGAAKNSDLHNFQFVLQLMLKRRITPDARTWIAFLMALTDQKVKYRVLQSMAEMNLLHDTSIKKAVCEHLVEDEISSSLDKHESLEVFLSHMDSRYGQEWMTRTSANRVLDAIGTRGLVSRCWHFMELMKSRDILPNVVSVNTVLGHCSGHDNPLGALEIVSRVSTMTDFVPDAKTFDILFDLAWKKRLYNVARVVWRYACLNAATTHLMRMRVQKSVLSAISTTPLQTASIVSDHSRSALWSATAGAFVVGAADPSSMPNGELERARVGTAFADVSGHLPSVIGVTGDLHDMQEHKSTDEKVCSRSDTDQTSTSLQRRQKVVDRSSSPWQITRQDSLLDLSGRVPTPFESQQERKNFAKRKVSANMNVWKHFRASRPFTAALREAMVADKAVSGDIINVRGGSEGQLLMLQRLSEDAPALGIVPRRYQGGRTTSKDHAFVGWDEINEESPASRVVVSKVASRSIRPS